jgi:hypothetical protein
MTTLRRPAFLNLIPLALALGALEKEKAKDIEKVASKQPDPPTALTRQQRRHLERSEAKAQRGGRG